MLILYLFPLYLDILDAYRSRSMMTYTAPEKRRGAEKRRYPREYKHPNSTYYIKTGKFTYAGYSNQVSVYFRYGK